MCTAENHPRTSEPPLWKVHSHSGVTWALSIAIRADQDRLSWSRSTMIAATRTNPDLVWRKHQPFTIKKGPGGTGIIHTQMILFASCPNIVDYSMCRISGANLVLYTPVAIPLWIKCSLSIAKPRAWPMKTHRSVYLLRSPRSLISTVRDRPGHEVDEAQRACK